jgi:serine/threonine protein kinase
MSDIIVVNYGYDKIVFDTKCDNNELFFVNFLENGSFGDVFLYENKNNEQFVVKKFYTQYEYLEEIQSYKLFELKGISDKINIKLIFCNKFYKMMVFNYLGETLDKINLVECHIRIRFNMMISIIDQNILLFKNNLIHNDLKLKNITFDITTQTISLIDYGLMIDISKKIHIMIHLM